MTSCDGGNGKDILKGGTSKDYLYGGADADMFDFTPCPK
ncbi:MAG: hypothetical protein U5N55_05740 [Cypionkella sp.]|nr:hypothetical protein [Cypionkella sp.]